MKKLLFVLLVGFPLLAADEFVVLYQCYTPRIVDGGYQLTVESGGFAGITQVKLAANTFAGSEFLSQYIVNMNEMSGSTIFAGKDIKLVVGPGEYPSEIGIPSKVYKASFVAKGNDGKKHQGILNCRSPQDPQ